jgi:hypothetical protein
MYIKDTDGVLANFNTTDTGGGFNQTKLGLLINTDKTVNLVKKALLLWKMVFGLHMKVLVMLPMLIL